LIADLVAARDPATGVRNLPGDDPVAAGPLRVVEGFVGPGEQRMQVRTIRRNGKADADRHRERTGFGLYRLGADRGVQSRGDVVSVVDGCPW
jgi:hypothetical protein